MKDILWIGNADYKISLQDFESAALKVKDHFPRNPFSLDRFRLPDDLIVVGRTFLVRLFPYWSNDHEPFWE